MSALTSYIERSGPCGALKQRFQIITFSAIVPLCYDSICNEEDLDKNGLFIINYY